MNTRSSIDNTAQHDPLIHLAGAGFTREGLARYSGEQESAGQAQLVNSTELPRRIMDSTGLKAFTDLGFVFGVYTGGPDGLFRKATLPEGWRKVGSDHTMWSYIVDQHGRRRVSIFYKAAFYDRDAFMRTESLFSYVNALAHGDAPEMPLVFDEWAPADAVLGEITTMQTDLAARRARMLEICQDEGRVAHYDESIAALDALRVRVEEAAGA